MHLCLGTVQFGMDYGIRGQKQPSPEDACQILDYATQNGISHIDTAKQYGTAEDVVGAFLRKRTIPRDQLFISTKFQPNRLDGVLEEQYEAVFQEEITLQLKRLGTDHIDAYLLHSSRYIYNDAILSALGSLKKKGYAKQVGVSVYETEEAKLGIEKHSVDYLQLPYSIFDQRMKNEGIFALANERKSTTIDTRSAFIQGLLLMEEDEVPPYLERAKPILRKIKALCAKEHLSRIVLALNYVKAQRAVSSLVFGVDDLEQLKEDIRCFQAEIDLGMIDTIAKEFSSLEADIVMPSLWKRNV